ncbi:hypothetical protein ABIB80_004552 [Bradyrhizobium sp. i1.15.2]
MNGLSSTLHALTLPEQWIAWSGKSAHARSALAGRFNDRILHESEVRLTARADLS